MAVKQGLGDNSVTYLFGTKMFDVLVANGPPCLPLKVEQMFRNTRALLVVRFCHLGMQLPREYLRVQGRHRSVRNISAIGLITHR